MKCVSSELLRACFFKGATNKTEIEQELKEWVEEIEVFRYILLTFLIVDGYWSRLSFSELFKIYGKPLLRILGV